MRVYPTKRASRREGRHPTRPSLRGSIQNQSIRLNLGSTGLARCIDIFTFETPPQRMIL